MGDPAERAGRDQHRASDVAATVDQAPADFEAMMPRDGRTTDYTDLRDTGSERMVYVFAHGDWHVGELARLPQAWGRLGGQRGVV